MDSKNLLQKQQYLQGLKQQGASLIIVLILMVVIAGIGISAVQISIMSERGARNDRDYQIAWQASEAALVDSEYDMRGPGTATRKDFFITNDNSNFIPYCGTSGQNKGLCLASENGIPTWLAVDFVSEKSPSVEFGDFTARKFDAGSLGIKPVRKPRYIIESILDTGTYGNAAYGADINYTYRVTAIGFGPREDIQAVTQMLFRK